MKKVTIALATAILASTLAIPAQAADTTARPTKLPIVLTLFLHDTLSSKERNNLNADYVKWFTHDLEIITGRKVEVVQIQRKAGYTDFDYRRGDADKSIYAWDQRVIDYVIDEQKPRDKRHKYVLVTPDNVTLFVRGVAVAGQRSAIASLTAYPTLAHEVGHLFGATHRDGKFHVNAAPLPCLTNMFFEDLFFVKSCYRYSEDSANAFRAYLKDIP